MSRTQKLGMPAQSLEGELVGRQNPKVFKWAFPRGVMEICRNYMGLKSQPGISKKLGLPAQGLKVAQVEAAKLESL